MALSPITYRLKTLYMKMISGMLFSQDIPLLRHSHMGIYFCNMYRAVPQHFLNIAYIHICFQQAGSKGVAKHMWSNMQFYCSNGSIFVYCPSDALIR